MKSSRVYAAGPLAGLATAALFYGMQGLIEGDGDVQLDDYEPPRWVDVVQDPIPPQVPEDKWKVEKPEIVEVEETKVIVDPAFGDPEGISIAPPQRPKIGGGDLEPLALGIHSEGDYMPIVLVQPTYPRRAQDRGIEGYVVVELTVAPDGSVPADSVFVVAAEPKGYFEREALKTAAKFKYKPKVVDGIAQPVTGVRYQFTFEMQD